MPYDQFVYTILTSRGSTVENPPTAYFKTLRTPEELVENTTQLFLAVRFNCNKCHDHPFERWTQNQYYHLAAFFAQIGRKDDPASNGEKLGGSSVDSPKALDRGRLRQRLGRRIARRHGQGGRARIPLPAQRPGRGYGLSPRAAGPLDHLAGQPILRQEPRQSAVGLSVRPRHYRADRRYPGRQPAHQSGTAATFDRRIRGQRLQYPGNPANDLQVANLPTVDHHQPLEPGRRHQLFARHCTPPAGGSAVRHDPARHGIDRAAPRPAPRLSCRAVARLGALRCRAASWNCSAAPRGKALANASVRAESCWDR